MASVSHSAIDNILLSITRHATKVQRAHARSEKIARGCSLSISKKRRQILVIDFKMAPESLDSRVGSIAVLLSHACTAVQDASLCLMHRD